MFSLAGSFFEDFLIISGLLLVQVAYGANNIFLNCILALGFDHLFIIATGSFIGAVIMLPIAIVLERKKWPKKLTSTMMVQFGLLALGGVTVFQGLLLLGIKRTTPAVASAMPNLVPGFVFLIAAILRYERFSIRCKYSMAKVLGTLVCLGGAIAMSLLQSPAVPKMFTILNATYDNINKDWMMGCFYLLAAIITVSCIIVLQAATMVNFPAPFSLYVLTSLMGSILTGFLQIIVEGKFDVGTPNLSIPSIISIIAAGSTISSICIVYQTWCVSKKGPLLVSIFSPVQTVCATSFSTILFGQAIGVGSSIGMILMFIGLYIVLWAKTKEGFEVVEGVQSKPCMPLDVEKPLLS